MQQPRTDRAEPWVRRGPGLPGSGRLGVLLAVGLLAVGTGCASLGSSLSGVGRSDDRVVRPDAPAEYDVLVGSLAAVEGRLEEARAAFGRAVTKDPDSAYLHRTLGRLAAQLEDLDGALYHATRALELAPDDSQARLFLGRLHRVRMDVAGIEAALLDEAGQPVDEQAAILLYQTYLEAGQLARALEVAQQIVAEDPGSLSGHMAVATAYERMGRRDEAEAALRAALVHHPRRFVLYSRLARSRRAADDRAGEIEIYREALAVQPDHYGTLVSLAEAQISIQDLSGAIATYERVLERFPEDRQSIRRAASLEFAAERYGDAALRLSRALERFPADQDLLYALGQVRLGAGDPEGAIAAFGAVEPGHESYVNARLQIADVLERRNDYVGALVEVERVRAIQTNRSLDFHAAALRARSGDFDGGMSLLESLRTGTSEDEEVLYQIGVLYGLDEQHDRAIETMQQVLELNPDNPHALNYIGYTWAERGEYLDEAERMILRALEIRPEDGYITDSLGWVYYMRARPLLGAGRTEDGRRLLEQALETLFTAAQLTGGDPVVSEHLGDVHLLLDQKQRALEFYEEALRMQPRHDEQPELLDKLEGLRRELSDQ